MEALTPKAKVDFIFRIIYCDLKTVSASLNFWMMLSLTLTIWPSAPNKSSRSKFRKSKSSVFTLPKDNVSKDISIPPPEK